jgi:hypothetical protein
MSSRKEHFFMGQDKKPWYKRVWVWIGIIFIVGVISVAASGENSTPKANTEADKSTESSQPKEEQPKAEKWDVDVAYGKVADGMTKAEVEAAIGKTSDNCSETSAEYVGKLESCNYGGIGDNGMIMVQYQNDKVSTKTKSKF